MSLVSWGGGAPMPLASRVVKLHSPRRALVQILVTASAPACVSAVACRGRRKSDPDYFKQISKPRLGTISLDRWTGITASATQGRKRAPSSAAHWNWASPLRHRGNLWLEAHRIARRALVEGVALADIAEIPSFGRSEQILGQSLGEERESAFLATKLFQPCRSPRYRSDVPWPAQTDLEPVTSTCTRYTTPVISSPAAP
jgi:hypothetical protein